MLLIVLRSLALATRSRVSLVGENLMLRQQLAVAVRSGKRPRLTWADRIFWVTMRRWHSGWRDALLIVKPETVIGWHRNQGSEFRPLGHLRHHRRSRLATDKALRNDNPW